MKVTDRNTLGGTLGDEGSSGTKGQKSLSIKLILVPTDFSLASEKALTYACAFARQFGAKLILQHVVEPIATTDFTQAFPIVADPKVLLDAAAQNLRGLVKRIEIPPEMIEKMEVRYGRGYHEIVELARELAPDLIIISTHGYTGLTHILLGSTAERVVRHATCPVLVVREQEHQMLSAPQKVPGAMI